MKRLILIIIILTALALPVLMHWAVIAGYRFIPLALSLLVAAVIVATVRARFSVLWTVALLLASGFVMVQRIALFYLPSMLVFGFLLIVFGSSLLPGRRPLISVLAERFHGHLSPQSVAYTRRVTQAWTLFFALLLLELIMLAVFAPISVWSWFANVLNYLFIALFFLLEFWLRRKLVTDVEHSGLRELLQFLKHNRLRTVDAE